MVEKVRRLQPKGDVLRQLFLKSGNQCAFPDCNDVMMNSSGVFIGQICHIEAAEEGGERFNSLQSNEDRRDFSNLMLMCYPHHQITNNVQEYPVRRLQRMKAVHEAIFSDVVAKMRASITDHTVASVISESKTLERMKNVLGWDLNEYEISVCAEELGEFAVKVKNLPVPTRKLLAIIIRRGKAISYGMNNRLETPLSELQHVCSMTKSDLREHLTILESCGVCDFGKDREERYEVAIVLNPKSADWCIAEDLREFCASTGIREEDIIVDLRFDLLDE